MTWLHCFSKLHLPCSVQLVILPPRDHSLGHRHGHGQPGPHSSTPPAPNSQISRVLFASFSDLPIKLPAVLPLLVSHPVSFHELLADGCIVFGNAWGTICLQPDPVKLWTPHRGRVLPVFEFGQAAGGRLAVVSLVLSVTLLFDLTFYLVPLVSWRYWSPLNWLLPRFLLFLTMPLGMNSPKLCSK